MPSPLLTVRVARSAESSFFCENPNARLIEYRLLKSNRFLKNADKMPGPTSLKGLGLKSIGFVYAVRLTNLRERR
ncbi:hypothetical protein GCM10010913_26750 [Paenibacillus aceti]|uniref:Uncharacterized protein n=1 Tax=Paenibacillus aceti TaxID=1820010 RepID=A0ABQ1VYA6_9BACL|nr:hypothetical protein GCM10010913_26750 [Paenibacillus aceti]